MTGKSLILHMIEGSRRGQQRTRWLDGNTNAMDINLGKLQEIVRDSKVWHAAVHGVSDTTRQMNNNYLLR